MYAQCPSCNTTFAITVAQIDARDGVVRCGRCFDVFNARWNLVDRQDHEKQTAAAKASTPRVELQQPAVSTPKHSVPPALNVRAKGSAEKTTRPTLRTDAETAPDTPAPGSQRSQLVSMRTDSGNRDTARVTEKLKGAFGKGEVVPGRRMTALDAATQRAQPAEKKSPVKTTLGKKKSARKDNSKDAADDSTVSLKKSERLKKTPANDDPAAQAPTSENEAVSEYEPTSRLSSGPSGHQPVIDRSQFDDLSVPTLDDETQSGEARSKVPAVFWLLGCCVLAGLLALQAKAFYLDDIAQRPALRPAGKLLCLAMRCELPTAVMFDEYQIEQTKIAFHPDAPAAIRISTSVRNGAKIEQPFPDLQLTLTDKTGKIVGRRNFRPAQYLGPTFRAEKKLAPESVTIIDLDLAEPAQNAIGFEVELVNPLSR